MMKILTWEVRTEKGFTLMELAKKFVEMKVSHHPQLFYLWGHAYEFEGADNWHVIEEFTEYMSGKEDSIWYATNSEIFEYIEDYKRLIFSADGTMVKNPTGRELWFSLNGTLYSIQPNEQLTLDIGQ